MGYNTVAIILNDALDLIRKDRDIGVAISDAVRVFTATRMGHRPKYEASAPARVGNSVHCNAISVVSLDHSSGWQIVAAGMNCGYRIGDPEREPVPEEVLAAAARALEEHGYKVTKLKAPKGRSDAGRT